MAAITDGSISKLFNISIHPAPCCNEQLGILLQRAVRKFHVARSKFPLPTPSGTIGIPPTSPTKGAPPSRQGEVGVGLCSLRAGGGSPPLILIQRVQENVSPS